MKKLSHVDARNRPGMVDVGAKAVTLRTAVAESRVRFPAAVARTLRDAGFATRKGPVFHTAIVAGVMAAKRTHELIPFCHPLAIERCKITIDEARAGRILIPPVTQLEISSTELRDLLAAGRDPRYLVPDPVRALIRATHSYSVSQPTR